MTVKSIYTGDIPLADLVRLLPVPVGLYDAQGNVILINDRLTTTFGYTLEDIPHLSRLWPLAFPDPQTRTKVQARWQAAVREAERVGDSDIAPDEYAITCKDGTVRLAEVFGTRIGDSTLVVLNDISERRHIETELARHHQQLEYLVEQRTRELLVRQERLEVALEATSTGLWEWDPRNGAMSSPSNHAMLGWTPDEFPAQLEAWRQRVHPDDWPGVQAFFQSILHSPDDTVVSHEYRHRSRQGTWRWISVRGQIVEHDAQDRVCRVVGVYSDTTERREKEQRLQMAVQALETTRECVYWIDEDGRMLYANPATAQELGYSAEELRQMSIPDIDPNMPQAMWGPEGKLTRILKSHGLRKFVSDHRHRAGHLIPVEVDTDAFEYDGQTYFIAIARDISERLATQAELRKSEAKFAAIFSLTPDPMALTRLADGVVLEVSRSFANYFGYTSEAVIGRSILPGDLSLWMDDAHRREWVDRLIENGETVGFEAPLRHKSGSVMTAQISGKILEISGEYCVIVDIHDITEQKQHAEHLERIAYHDPLTNLPNRLLLGDRLRQAIIRNERSDVRVAVCYIDLDGFKEVNDRFGHQAGDELLVDVAHRLTASVRGGDTVARLGGDEFVVLLFSLTDDEQCRAALQRLLATLSAPYAIGETQYPNISASIGVTLYPDDPADPDTLVRHADHAMYAAKQAGKNRIQWFDTHLEQRIEARHATLRGIAEALAAHQFHLYFQPKVDCSAGRIVGAEALIRWQHPILGLLSPAEFLPLIEGTELAYSVGDWVLREALAHGERWRREGIELRISVNVFVQQLLHPDFTDRVAALLAQYTNSGSSHLMIEIVETAALRELDIIREVVDACRQLGVAFSLDDFGTGYSTLAHLRHLPASEIKIDQSFVQHMLTRTEDLTIVEAVIGLGHAFKRTVVAEGVETPAHIVRLLELGCTVMQGYALARPLAGEDFVRWVRNFRADPDWRRSIGPHIDP